MDGSPTGMNLYGYCGGNPVMFSDPSGHYRVKYPDGSMISDEGHFVAAPGMTSVSQSAYFGQYCASTGYTPTPRDYGIYVQQSSGASGSSGSAASYTIYTGNGTTIYKYFGDPSFAPTINWFQNQYYLCMEDLQLPIGDAIYLGGGIVIAISDAIAWIGAGNLANMIAAAPDTVAKSVEWTKEQVRAVSNWFKEISGGTGMPDPNNGGFKTFRALKNFLGKAQDGYQWHHIVEQSQIRKSGFDPTNIHNPLNVIQIPKELHNKITAIYNSRPDWANGLRVRDFLAGTSFEYQYNYGLTILRQVGAI